VDMARSMNDGEDDAYTISVVEANGRSSLRRPGRRWEGISNIW
jgi:hypothetical protein